MLRHDVLDGRAAHQAFVDDAEGRGAGHGVGPEQALGLRPGGHVGREGDEQEHAAHEGGVPDVLAQAAEGHLGDADGDDRADEHDPPGRRVRQVQAQEDTRHDRGEVAQGGGLLEEETGDGPFQQEAGAHAHGHHEDLPPAVEDEGAEHRGQERDHDIQHQGPGGVLGMDVG